jgi:hypothetical protein
MNAVGWIIRATGDGRRATGDGRRAKDGSYFVARDALRLGAIGD